MQVGELAVHLERGSRPHAGVSMVSGLDTAANTFTSLMVRIVSIRIPRVQHLVGRVLPAWRRDEEEQCKSIGIEPIEAWTTSPHLPPFLPSCRRPAGPHDCQRGGSTCPLGLDHSACNRSYRQRLAHRLLLTSSGRLPCSINGFPTHCSCSFHAASYTLLCPLHALPPSAGRPRTVESHRHLDSDEVRKKLGDNFHHPLSDIEKNNKRTDTDGCCPWLTSCCANGYQSLYTA